MSDMNQGNNNNNYQGYNNQNYNNQNYNNQGYNNQGYYNQNTYNQQQNYQPNNYQPNNYQDDLERPVSVGDWLGTFFLMLIPIVNVIMIIVWAASGTEKKSKVNWAKATLIFEAIILLVALAFYLLLFASIFSSSSYY